jgi:hypothetical protein
MVGHEAPDFGEVILQSAENERNIFLEIANGFCRRTLKVRGWTVTDPGSARGTPTVSIELSGLNSE